MMNTYVAITPARDEQALLPGLIKSVLAQSSRPTRWILIDDGSSDNTGQIADSVASEHEWIEVHHLCAERARQAGGESVVMRFLPSNVWERYEFVLRLDADLTFGPELAAMLLRELNADRRLGIAGATLHEPTSDGWRESRQPSFHTRGAVKMYRRECFAAIGGLDAGLGWDTLDEARAMMSGFRTRSFRHIRARHHRPQGAVDGIWKSRLAAGRAAYRIGYSPWFMLARAARRTLHRPMFVESAALMTGFLEGYVRQSPKAASPELEKFVRREQVRRLLGMESRWR